MRIGIDIAMLAGRRTGVETYISRLVQAFARGDGAHSYFLYSSRAVDLCVPEAWTVRSGPRGLRTDLWRQAWLPRQVARDRIDLFHSPIPAHPLRLGCRLVVTLHDLCWHAVPEGYGLGERLSQRWWLDQAVRRARRLICVSKSTARDVVSLYPRSASKIDVIHEAIDERYLAPPDERCLAALKQRLGIYRPFVLSVGTISPRKNIDRLLDAFAALATAHSRPLQLVIAGRAGWRADQIERRRERLGLGNDIVMAGYVDDDDLRALYAGARILVIVSLYEGFGLPVLEAMASGTPVIASERSSLPEVVGDAGMLVDPCDAAQIAEAIRILDTDGMLRGRLIERGRRRVASFSWEETARQTLEVFAVAAQGRAR